MLDQAKLAEKSISGDHGVPYAVCNEKLSHDYVNQRFFVSELDSALEKGEFLPYYQPVVDAKTGEIVSAEALIRWKHSEKGMIPPGMFIPVFEKEGLTTKLDSFMVNNVLNFNIERMKNGQKVVPCAVNLSRVDFYDTKLLGMLKKKLQDQENIQDMLKLEITESACAVLESDAVSFLEEMKKLRLSFLLDDFGSGMSSLSTLELYDFDTIKLDMGFIRKIGKSPKAEAIIRHTIGMAHEMGAKVVAEGVEDEEQLAFLQSVDCDMIQGYYFYKPMPEEEFAALL
jgi:EAL domain-containing protein (putative c-di-GMP-specific phosphodiesterase class I)